MDFNNNNQIDKKFKSYKKDLNDQFKNKISKLKDLTLNQEKFNSLISELISNLSLDEEVSEDEKREEDDKEDKQSKPENQNQKAQEKKKSKTRCLLIWGCLI